MKTKRAKHNLSRVKMSCVVDTLEKGVQAWERELELATSRPACLRPLKRRAINNTQEA